MRCRFFLLSFCLFAATTFAQQPASQTAPPGTNPGTASTANQVPAEPTLPYIPSLDVSAMDRSVDPCVDFYHYSCGGWEQKNPIPADQVRWDVYSKLYEDNLNYLRGILEEASAAKSSDAVTQKIGDYYAACMNESAVEKLGAKPMQPALDEVQALKSVHDLAPVVARLHLAGDTLLFDSGSEQDPDNSDAMIVGVGQDGLGLPDRDYYTKEDAKSKEIRARYLLHVQKVFELIGDSPATAKKEADTVMRIETGLAKASLTRVDRRDPYKVKHKMKPAELNALTPNFDWTVYFSAARVPRFEILNVESPAFLKEVNAQLTSTSLADWKSYLRFHIANSRSPFLSSAFVNENFAFYRQYLRGAKELQPRWKRCVQYVDRQLGEGARTGLRAQDVSTRTKGRHSRHDQGNRRRHGGAHPAIGLDESADQAAGAE